MNPYIVLGIIGLFVSSLYFAYDYGRNTERLKNATLIEQFRKKEANLMNDLETAKAKREIEYRDRIKVIKETVDDCINRPISQPLLDSLRSDSAHR